MSNHLGNVLVTISDKKLAVASATDPNLIAYYNADVVTANDYYPFGSQMPGRKFAQANSSYRYGFNGKEKLDEIEGDGNAYDFEARILSPRLGRFLSVDPMQQKLAGFSPYAYCYNSPLKYVDPDGKLGIVVDVMYNEKTKGYTIIKITISADVAYNPNTSQGMASQTHYNDYIKINKYTPRKDFPTPALDVDFTYLSERTTTFFRNDGYANWKVNDGVYENNGGIMWTSNSGGGEESRKGTASSMTNIDLLMAAIGGTKSALGAKPLEAPSVETITELVEKITGIIQEFSDKKPLDKIDFDDPNLKKSIEEAQKIISATTTTEINTKPAPVNKTKTVKGKWQYSNADGGATDGGTTSTETKPSNNSKTPDTVVTTYHTKTPNPSKNKK